jgi:hypothetical protein
VKLEDDRILGDYNVKRDAIFDLITPLNSFPITVKTQEGKKVGLEVNPGDSIRAVKQQLKRKEGG